MSCICARCILAKTIVNINRRCWHLPDVTLRHYVFHDSQTLRHYVFHDSQTLRHYIFHDFVLFESVLRSQKARVILSQYWHQCQYPIIKILENFGFFTIYVIGYWLTDVLAILLIGWLILVWATFVLILSFVEIFPDINCFRVKPVYN